MVKIALSIEEKRELEQAQKESSSIIFRRRSECILLASSFKLKAKDLKVHFGVHIQTIYSWLNLWKSGGIESLYHEEGQGRKLKLREISREELRKLMDSKSQNLKLVQEELDQKYGVSVSKKTLIRFLKR